MHMDKRGAARTEGCSAAPYTSVVGDLVAMCAVRDRGSVPPWRGRTFLWQLPSEPFVEHTWMLAPLLTAALNRYENHSCPASMCLSAVTRFPNSPRSLPGPFRSTWVIFHDSGCHRTLSHTLRQHPLRPASSPKHQRPFLCMLVIEQMVTHLGLSWCPNKFSLAFIWCKIRRSLCC